MSSRNIFNEATRVQMPALVHLNRLGYNYFGKVSEEQANIVYDPETNILIDVFKKQFATLNPSHSGDADQVLKTIRQELDNDDLGRSFYKRLTTVSPVRLVDFTNPQNNVYHCTAEFTCKRDQDEFRPDITLFVNGLPLVFIEVKKPNNPGGMVAESTRMNKQRFPNKKFRRFINITQLMIFSNNMEYDTMGGIVPIQGAFYCTASRDKAPFNCFREENPTGAKIAPFIKEYPYKEIDPAVEKKILTDFNCQVIHTAPEYQTNLDINTPTNRIITSMCSPERLLFLIIGIKCNASVDGYTDFIFLNRDGNLHNQSSLNSAIHRIRRDCNDEILLNRKTDKEPVLLPYFTCHHLRHTFATRLCESGINIKVIQNVLGHVDISTTMNIYIDVTKDLKKEEMQNFANYVRSGNSKEPIINSI